MFRIFLRHLLKHCSGISRYLLICFIFKIICFFLIFRSIIDINIKHSCGCLGDLEVFVSYVVVSAGVAAGNSEFESKMKTLFVVYKMDNILFHRVSNDIVRNRV